MNEDDLPQFGTRVPGLDYAERPSVYGIAQDDSGRILACRRSRERLVLPGGGLDHGESLESALVREIAEETACRVVAFTELCRARQYHTQRTDKMPANKLCHFFVTDLEPDPGLEPEPDHAPVWMLPGQLVPVLTFESHRWAVGMFLQSGSTRR